MKHIISNCKQNLTTNLDAHCDNNKTVNNKHMKTKFKTLVVLLCMIGFISCNAHEKKEKEQIALLETEVYNPNNLLKLLYC